MGGTLWLKSSSGPKSLPPAGVLLPAFETNRVSVCGGTAIERDSHRTGKRLADPIGSDRPFSLIARQASHSGDTSIWPGSRGPDVQDFTFNLQTVTRPGWIWPFKFTASPRLRWRR